MFWHLKGNTTSFVRPDGGGIDDDRHDDDDDDYSRGDENRYDGDRWIYVHARNGD